MAAAVQDRWNQRETAESSVGELLLEPHTPWVETGSHSREAISRQSPQAEDGIEKPASLRPCHFEMIWTGRQGTALPLTQPDVQRSWRSNSPFIWRFKPDLVCAGWLLVWKTWICHRIDQMSGKIGQWKLSIACLRLRLEKFFVGCFGFVLQKDFLLCRFKTFCSDLYSGLVALAKIYASNE